MPEIRVLTETDLRALVPLDLTAIDQVERGFVALAGGKVVMPPILSMAIAEYNGEIDVKTAYVPGIDSFAVKLSPGFFDNPKMGLPSTSGLMVLLSAKTGVLEALLLDNGYLTDVRTAAAGAIAARHLSRPDVRSALIVGAGVQARLQLKALSLVREITSARIWARDADKAGTAANEMSKELGFEVTLATDLSNSVPTADIIVTTTPSAEPLIAAEWLRPGQHITAMGSDQEHKNELDPTCLAKADRYVPDRQSQTEKLGELHSAIAAGIVPSSTRISELGEIAAGMAAGRQADTDITIADLTGTGVQDTAIATLARLRADERGTGTRFTT